MERRLHTMTGVFKDLNAIRRERRQAAEPTKEWAVSRICADGRLAKTPSAFCANEQEAEAKAADLRRLNPTLRFMATKIERN